MVLWAVVSARVGKFKCGCEPVLCFYAFSMINEASNEEIIRMCNT